MTTSEAWVERACEVMHDAYEGAAIAAGWETQERSRKPWGEVPEANKATMRVAVAALLDWLSTQECEDCGDPMPDGPSCDHDGHFYCDACYVDRCGECKADLIDSMRSER